MPTQTVNFQPASFSELKCLVVDQGLLARQPAYYSLKFATTGLMLAAALITLCQGPRLPVWVQLLNGIYLAFVWGQIGLLGHDVGHGQVFRSERLARVVGVVLGNLLVGVSFGWWRRNHGAHHQHPNHIELDPAVNFNLLAFTPQQALAKPRHIRWLIRHQSKVLVLLACFELVNLHVESLVYLREERLRRRAASAVEAALLAVHASVYVGGLVFMLGPALGLLVVCVHYGLSGLYLASLFAPNHKGMPIVDSTAASDYLHDQVLTARNMAGGALADFWFGGLNRQIEHHLFPSMPRNCLKAAAPLVRAFCAQNGVAYRETSVAEAYRELFVDFERIGSALAGSAECERPEASSQNDRAHGLQMLSRR